MANLEECRNLLNSGKHEEALKCCNHVIDDNAKDSNAYYCKAETLYKLNRNEDAMKACHTSLSIDLNNKESWDLLKHLEDDSPSDED